MCDLPFVCVFLCSNPKVQIEAIEGGALQKLLVILATEQPQAVKKKVSEQGSASGPSHFHSAGTHTRAGGAFAHPGHPGGSQPPRSVCPHLGAGLDAAALPGGKVGVPAAGTGLGGQQRQELTFGRS